MSITYNDGHAPHTPHKPHTGRFGLFGAIGDFFSLLPRGIAAARTYETLDHLSDAQLARRGLTRQDIAHVAMRVLLDES